MQDREEMRARRKSKLNSLYSFSLSHSIPLGLRVGCQASASACIERLITILILMTLRQTVFHLKYSFMLNRCHVHTDFACNVQMPTHFTYIQICYYKWCSFHLGESLNDEMYAIIKLTFTLILYYKFPYLIKISYRLYLVCKKRYFVPFVQDMVDPKWRRFWRALRSLSKSRTPHRAHSGKPSLHAHMGLQSTTKQRFLRIFETFFVFIMWTWHSKMTKVIKIY
jgi:hypothetical protein